MKLSINNRTKNRHSITSYRFVIGCKKAKELGFLDEKGNGREVIMIPQNTGILFVPVEQKLGKLTYGGCSTEICQYGNLFFGEIPELPNTPTWFCKSIDSAEQKFHTIVDTVALP